MGIGIGWGKGLYEVDERGEGENEVKGGRNMSCGDSILLFPCLHREWSRIPHYPFQLVGNCSPYHNHRMFQQSDRVMIDKESVTLISIHTLLPVSNSRNTPPLLTSFHKQTQISNSQIHSFTVFKCTKP